LYCSLPLCRILSGSEVSAVIDHELGHFKGLDTNFSESFYPIYCGTASAIGALLDHFEVPRPRVLPKPRIEEPAAIQLAPV
jgi:Zn-dependent protease with chaperone function